MISKKTRRSTKAVEPLNQFPITAGKGIDISKPADALTTVQEIENFDVNSSGDLELRKPMLVKQFFPASDTDNVLRVFPLYDSNYRLVVYTNLSSAKTWIRIVDTNGTAQPLQYMWYNYCTEEEYLVSLTEQDLLNAEKTPFDWSEVQLENLSTASVCTNVRVDVCSSVFKINNAFVLHDPTLLPSDTRVYREIQITYSPYIQTWLVKIITPLMNTLLHAEDSGELPFDANQALDNPYALRDSYNSVAPTVKGALAYVLSEPSEDGTVKVCTGVTNTQTNTRTFTVANPVYSEDIGEVRIIGATVDTLSEGTGGNLFEGTVRCAVNSNITNHTLANPQISMNDSLLFEVPIASIIRYYYAISPSQFEVRGHIYDTSYAFYLDAPRVDNSYTANITELQFDDSGYLKTIVLPVIVREKNSTSEGHYLSVNYDPRKIFNDLQYATTRSTSSFSTLKSAGWVYPEAKIVKYFANRILQYTQDWAGYANLQSTVNGPKTTVSSRIQRCLKTSDISLSELNRGSSANNTPYNTGVYPNGIIHKGTILHYDDSGTSSSYQTVYLLVNPDTRHEYLKFPNALTLSVRSGVDDSTQPCVPTTPYLDTLPEEYATNYNTMNAREDYWKVL